MGEAKGEHRAMIISVWLLITFAMWRAITLVGIASIFRKFTQCSKRVGIGGGGISDLDEDARRIKQIKRNLNKIQMN